MNRTGVRKLAAPEGLAELSRAERIEALRGKMSALGVAAAPRSGEIVEDISCLDIGVELGKILPGGGLYRRAVTEMTDCPALVIEMIARVTAGGGHVGVVAWPELSFAGVSESGGDLSKVLAIPDPGPDAINTSAVLSEGLDLVVHHSATELSLSPVRARPLLARLRNGRAALLMVGMHVPSPALSITARVTDFHGITAGSGRIRGLSVSVSASQKNRPRATAVITVGSAGTETSQASRAGLRVV